MGVEQNSYFAVEGINSMLIRIELLSIGDKFSYGEKMFRISPPNITEKYGINDIVDVVDLSTMETCFIFKGENVIIDYLYKS